VCLCRSVAVDGFMFVNKVLLWTLLFAINFDIVLGFMMVLIYWIGCGIWRELLQMRVYKNKFGVCW